MTTIIIDIYYIIVIIIISCLYHGINYINILFNYFYLF